MPHSFYAGEEPEDGWQCAWRLKLKGHLRLPCHPSVNKHPVIQLARCEYVDRRENVVAIGNSRTGMTHVALTS